jgi:SAM-dependent methyltransferase
MKYEDISGLAMWEDWQEIVKRSLPDFAASPIYVQQRSQTQEDFERTAEYVRENGVIDPMGKTRDALFGGLVRDTRALGLVTRMWLDSNVEIDFLRRHFGFDLGGCRVLDIGAGYGRLAVPLSVFTGSYTCVDAVPISTIICRQYAAQFAPLVRVPSLDEFMVEGDHQFDLAINIHSWNECSISQIANWLQLLVNRNVRYLFTVSNGSLQGGRQAYSSWGGTGESFRPLIEARYELIKEESIGLSFHPHSLWRLKR